MSDSEVDADAIPADPLWEPATLPCVLREDKQRVHDKGKCQLCDMRTTGFLARPRASAKCTGPRARTGGA